MTSPDIETIGVLTSGGDCPGLNAVIRGVVRKAEREFGWRTLGFHDGYMGLIEDSFEELTIEGCRGILPRGGTADHHEPTDASHAARARRDVTRTARLGCNA